MNRFGLFQLLFENQRLLAIASVGLGLCVLVSADSLGLDQLLELADRSHPQLRLGQAQMDTAVAGITTARAYPNPSIDFLAGRQTARGTLALPGVGPSTFYGFTQPLELGALRASRRQLAERGRDSSQAALEETRLVVLTGVRRGFFQVLRWQGEAEITADHLRRVQELRRRIQVRVDVGEAGRLEALRAEAEEATARALANGSRLQLAAALAHLRAAVSAPIPDDLELLGELDASAALPSLEDLRRETLQRHPALALVRAEVDRAQSRLTYEKALKRPQPLFRTEIDLAPDNPTYRVGLALPLPLWNKREGPIAEATAAVTAATAFLEARQVEILSALEGAYERYQIAGQQVAAFEQSLLSEADQALAASEAAYQLGERGILEVLDAQRVLRVVRTDFLNARYDRQSALIDLDELRGADLRRMIP